MNRTVSDAGPGPSRSGPSKTEESEKDSSDAAAEGRENDEGGVEGKDSAIEEDSKKEMDRRKEDSTESMDVDTEIKCEESEIDTEIKCEESEIVGTAEEDRKQSDKKDDLSVDTEGQGSLPGQSSEGRDPSEGDAAGTTVRRKSEESEKEVKNEDLGEESEKGTAEEEEDDAKRKEEEKKGVFALGDRMQDRNPTVSMTGKLQSNPLSRMFYRFVRHT